MDLLTHITIIIAIYAILAMSLDLVVGYTGLLSLAHAAFFGIGAYAVAILTTRFEWNFFLTALLGALISACAALLMGLFLKTFKDDYYALASLGFNIIIYGIMLNAMPLTAGPLGIGAIPRPSFFGLSFDTNERFLVLILFCAAGTYFFMSSLVKKNAGLILRAIREDELLVSVLGFSAPLYKRIASILAAVFASFAGALFASYVSFIEPTTFAFTESVLILAMCIIGGLGTLKGSIFGAIALVFLPEILRFVGTSPEIIAPLRLGMYGFALVVLMRYRPQGIVGKFQI